MVRTFCGPQDSDARTSTTISHLKFVLVKGASEGTDCAIKDFFKPQDTELCLLSTMTFATGAHVIVAGIRD